MGGCSNGPSRMEAEVLGCLIPKHLSGSLRVPFHPIYRSPVIPRHLHTSCPFPGHSCPRVFPICLPPHSSLYLTPPKPGFMTQCKYCLRRAIRYVPTPTKQRFIATEVQGVWQRWHGTENITVQRTLSWEAPPRRAIWCLHCLTLPL